MGIYVETLVRAPMEALWTRFIPLVVRMRELQELPTEPLPREAMAAVMGCRDWDHYLEILARKPGKLPYKTETVSYGLEYGTEDARARCKRYVDAHGRKQGREDRYALCGTHSRRRVHVGVFLTRFVGATLQPCRDSSDTLTEPQPFLPAEAGR